MKKDLTFRIPCRDCDEVLPNKFELYKHRQKEHCDEALGEDYEDLPDKDTTICLKCGHNLHNVNALQKHLKEVHGIESDYNKSTCPICSCAFHSVTARNEHMRTHTTLRRPSMIRHRLPHNEARVWNCVRCAKRFRLRTELRAHQRLKHPSYTAVIEMNGSNPTQEQVLRHLALNNIDRDKVVEISYITFPKGSANIIPNSHRALELLGAAHWTKIKLDKQTDEDHQLPIGPIAKVSHVPAILQHKMQLYNEPNYSSTDMQPINVQQLFQDCNNGSNKYYN